MIRSRVTPPENSDAGVSQASGEMQADEPSGSFSFSVTQFSPGINMSLMFSQESRKKRSLFFRINAWVPGTMPNLYPASVLLIV